MFLNENNVVCDIMGIHMIINTENERENDCICDT